MTLLLGFLLTTVFLGIVCKRLGAWAYVLITSAAILTTMIFYGAGRFWS
jgi:hypothetical protein